MENNEPLVKGGCGHSDKEVTESAAVVTLSVAISLIIAVIAMI